MYVNGKTIPVATIPGTQRGGTQENGRGVNLSMIKLKYCKNFCKSLNVSPLQAQE
jgi:hypothetical protein